MADRMVTIETIELANGSVLVHHAEAERVDDDGDRTVWLEGSRGWYLDGQLIEPDEALQLVNAHLQILQAHATSEMDTRAES